MADLWLALSPAWQDGLWLVLLLLPGLLTGVFVLRGLAPYGLAMALWRRFAGINLVFVALMSLSIALGTGLSTQDRGLRQGSARAAEKFDLIVAAPGSEITAMLAAVYLQPSDMALLDGATYDAVARTEGVAMAAPIAFGDSHDGAPILGTTAAFLTHLAGPLAEGRAFATPAEAVVGAFVPLTLGQSLTPAHGMEPAPAEHHDEEDHADHHEGFSYTVVGRMAPTGSPWDRAILVPVEGVWGVHGLANGHAPGSDHLGPPFDPAYMPGTPAIVVRASEVWGNYALKSRFTTEKTMAFFPGTVLSNLHGLMGDLREVMSLLALVCQILVGISVLTGLLLLVRLIGQSLGLLRAIGAPGRFVLALVWTYGASLICTSAALGLGLGWGLARALSAWITARTDVLVTAALGWPELHLVAGFVSLTLTLSLIPSALALRLQGLGRAQG